MTTSSAQCAKRLYDLSGLSAKAVCPECGSRERFGPTTRTFKTAHVLLLFALFINVGVTCVGVGAISLWVTGSQSGAAAFPPGSKMALATLLVIVLPLAGFAATVFGFAYASSGLTARRDRIHLCVVLAWIPALVLLLALFA